MVEGGGSIMTLEDMLARLRHRSLGELIHRAKVALFKEYERIVHPLERRPWDDRKLLSLIQLPGVAKLDLKALLNYMRRRQFPRFFIHPSERREQIDFITENHPEWIDRAVEFAELSMKHKFSFLGISVQYGDKIPWNSDPLSGREWPRVFYSKVPIYSGDIGYGDVKHVWELNRHGFLADLGKAYWLTGETKYASKFFELATDWIRENPYNTGVNWSSTLELA